MKAVSIPPGREAGLILRILLRKDSIPCSQLAAWWLVACFILPSFHSCSPGIHSRQGYRRQGMPLPFVSVYVEGTSKGTTTNTDGFYKLNLEEGEVRLAFRFIGYKLLVKDLSLSGEMELNVALTRKHTT